MPTSPLRPCSAPNCHALVRFGRCAAHPRQTQGEGWERTSRAAPKRMRGRAWMTLRAQVLSEEPVCYACGRLGVAADYVDHIVALVDGGTDDRSNLHRICRDCSKHKTALESARARQSGRGLPNR